MKPQVRLNLIGLQMGSDWQVQEMDWAIPGGAHSAILSADIQNPTQISSEMVKAWFGRAVEICNPAGEVLWHGWIEAVSLESERLRLRWDCSQMINRVIARYPTVSALLDPYRHWTYSSWVEDQAGVDRLGAWEKLLTLEHADAGSALQVATNHLSSKSKTSGTQIQLLEKYTSPRLVLHASGWWQRLDWTLDGEEGGMLAHLPGGKSQQPFGLSGIDRLAQRFQVGGIAFALGQICLRAALIGAPADQVRVLVCADSGACPGTVLATASLPNYALHGGWQWLTWQLDTALNLSAGSFAWMVVERSAGLDSSNHYVLETDDGRGYPDGELRCWNGSDWILRNQDLRFCLLAVTETTGLMREVAERAVQGGVLRGVQIWKDSGVQIPRWRALEKTRRAALEEWLAIGCVDGNELSALINPTGILEVFSLPRLAELPLQLGMDGRLCMPAGTALPPANDLLGRRLLLPGAGGEEEGILQGLRWTKEGGLLPVMG
jgi:hypothetical protein